MRYLYFPYGEITEKHHPPMLLDEIPSEFKSRGDVPLGHEIREVGTNVMLVTLFVRDIPDDLNINMRIPRGPSILYKIDSNGKVVDLPEDISQLSPRA